MTTAASPIRRHNPTAIKIGLRVGILLAVLALWQAFGNDAVRLSMPTFTGTMSALAEMIGDGSLIEGLLITNQAMVLGYLLALAVSLPLGIGMGTTRNVQRIAEPYLMILLAAPMIALVPIVQAAFGLTLAARVVVVFLFCFVYMTVNTMVGVRSVDPGLREMGRSLTANRMQMLRYIVLPAAVPGIMAGVRLGLGRAMIGMVVAELSLIGAGIGSLIIDYQVRFQPAYVFAIVLAVVLEGVLLMEIARRVELHFARWRGSQAVE